MFGSNIIIVEHFEKIVFEKFVAVFLAENGFTDIETVVRKTNIGINFTAKKKVKKYAMRIEYEKNPTKKNIDDLVNAITPSHSDSAIIFTKYELQNDIKKYILKSNCSAITKLEIEQWLLSRFTSVLDFIDYLEMKEIRRGKLYTNRELIRKYEELKAALGKQPSMYEIDKNMDISYGMYAHRWGTFRNFLTSVQDTPRIRFARPNRSMTASVSDLVEDYIRLRKRLKRIPTNLEIENKGKFTSEYYSVFFGSISNFIMVVENEINNVHRYKKKDLIREYRSIQDIVKRTPTFNDVNKKSKISPIIFLYHWGTWNEFLLSMGETKQYTNINDKELVKAYFHIKEKLGKNPNQIEFMKSCGISHDAFAYRFGSWNNFVELLEYPEFISPTAHEIDLFTDYYRIKKILNKQTLSQDDIKKHTLFSYQDYIQYFGSFKNITEKIEEIEKKSELISEEELIHEYLRLLFVLKKTWLTVYDIRNHSSYPYTLYLSRFYVWSTVIKKMQGYVGRIKYPKHITNKQIIDDYHRVEKELNKSPLFVGDYETHGKYSEGIIRQRFVSWKKFLDSIGQKSVLDITKEELTEDYFRVKTLLQKEVLYRRDYEKHGKYSETAINNRFGKWSDFLKGIGEDTSHIKKINKEVLIADYNRVKTLLGKGKVNQTEMEEYGEFTKSTYSRHFGGWDKFLEYMGEDTSKFQHSEQTMIDEYFRVKELLKKERVSIKDMTTYAKVSGALYGLRFGSWKKFLEKIGEDTTYMTPITDEDLKAEYIRIKGELKKSKLILSDIKQYGKYKSKAYLNHFGSWDNFVRIMGDGNSRNLYSDEDVIKEYRRVKKLLGKEYITLTDMRKHSAMSATFFRWRFGTWEKFLIHIGEVREEKESEES